MCKRKKNTQREVNQAKTKSRNTSFQQEKTDIAIIIIAIIIIVLIIIIDYEKIIIYHSVCNQHKHLCEHTQTHTIQELDKAATGQSVMAGWLVT